MSTEDYKIKTDFDQAFEAVFSELPEAPPETPIGEPIVEQNQLEYRNLINNNQFFKQRPQYHSVLNKLISRGNAVANYLLNPDVTASDDVQRFHAESSLARLSWYVTNWENLNGVDFPPEAFESFDNPNFWAWWMHKPNGNHPNLKEGPSKVTEDYALDSGYKLPMLVYHGTLAYIDPKTGFVQSHPDMVGGSAYWNEEMGPHAGTARAAQERVLHLLKRSDQVSVEEEADVIEESTKMTYDSLKGASGKFYMGFLKVNNPLRLQEYEGLLRSTGKSKGGSDLGSWRFDNVMDTLHIIGAIQEGGFSYSDSDTYSDETKMKTTYEVDGKLQSKTINTPHLQGSGSAILAIQQYMEALYKKDHGEGKTLDEEIWMANEGVFGDFHNIRDDEWGITRKLHSMELTDGKYDEKKGEILDDIRIKYEDETNYYALKALALFIQNDLGYDGISYLNDVEDPGSESWIIFQPNQFKSIFNKGTYEWGEPGKPHKNYMTKRKPNKYKKRKAVA